MAERFSELSPQHIEFIQVQHIFFVSTVGAKGNINLSPKGTDSFRVVQPKQVIWLNLTGSGNETAAHLLENPRMTLMFCSFDKKPLILRLYGNATAFHPYDSAWDELVLKFPANKGARQIFLVDLDLVQTSCGYAVPRYELIEERDTLTKWAENKGREGIQKYWEEKNLTSLDGYPTGIKKS